MKNSGCAPGVLCVLHFRNLKYKTKPQKLQLSRDALGIDSAWLKVDGQLSCAEL